MVNCPPPAAQGLGYNVTHHTFIHESIKKFLDGFHYDAHPMGMMMSTIAALSTFYHDRKTSSVLNRARSRLTPHRKMPTIAAFSYRHTLGSPSFIRTTTSATRQFPEHAFRTTEPKYRAESDPRTGARRLFILHADHEQKLFHHTIAA